MILENSTKKIRPVLKWAGGKSSLLSQLFLYFPRTMNRYLEPFLGAGSVYLSLLYNVPMIVNDVNYELFLLYTVIRDHPDELMFCLDEFQKKYSETFFYELRKNVPISQIQQAARTIFLNKTCFNGLFRQNRKGEFNVPFGKKTSCPTLYDKEHMINFSLKLKNTLLRNEDFQTIVESAEKGDFIYCDPPYEPLSKTSSFRNYNSTGFSQDDQKRLFKSCVAAEKRGVKIAISNSTAPFILDLYQDCKIQKIFAKRNINSLGSRRGVIEEVLILMGMESEL